MTHAISRNLGSRVRGYRHASIVLCWVLAATVTSGAQTQPARPAPKPVPKPAPKTSAPSVVAMTNADVVKMVNAALSEALIVASIRQAEKRAFSLTADGLVELKAAGVSDNIVLVMLDPTAVITPAAPAPPVPALAPDPVSLSPTAAPDPVLPPSTIVAVRTIDVIKSNGAASDLEYRATVDDSVVVGGVTVAPVGTPAFLRVVQVQQAGAVRGRASVSVRLVGLEINGRRLNFETGDASIASGSQGARAARTGVTGAVIGGILGGLLGGRGGAAQGAAAGAAVGVTAAVVAGQKVEVPSETRLSFTVNSSTGYAASAAVDNRLLDELIALEKKVGEFAKAGDRASIEALLTPECTLTMDGKTVTRSQYLSGIKPQPSIISSEIESPSLVLDNDRAVLTGYYVIQVRQRSQTRVVRQKFRDVLVQREGRWMLLASEVASQ